LLRDKLGYLPNTEVEFEVDGDRLLLRKVETERGRGRALVEGMRGKATVDMTTEQILALTREE
jgi:hypothetical protein